MNNAQIAGHLGSDPEVRFTSTGQKVTVMRVAARARKDQTIWWRVTLWGDQFDKMIPFFKKGSPIVVVGEIAKPEIFNDRDGKPQISMGMTASQVFFSPFGRDKGTNENASGSFQKESKRSSQEGVEAAFDSAYQKKSEEKSSFDEDSFSADFSQNDKAFSSSSSQEGEDSFSMDDEVPF